MQLTVCCVMQVVLTNVLTRKVVLEAPVLPLIVLREIIVTPLKQNVFQVYVILGGSAVAVQEIMDVRRLEITGAN